jgi:transposase InsO family protein
MSDAGGEYKSQEFDDFLKSKGIKILQSVPHQPEQNRHAERFNRTIMDKAQALHFTACLPQNWWEFAIIHAVHLYNRTPVQRLKWKTPYELLTGDLPSLDHLRVFGCAAHVFLHEDI